VLVVVGIGRGGDRVVVCAAACLCDKRARVQQKVLGKRFGILRCDERNQSERSWIGPSDLGK
jgi:hypothetical protein